MSSFRTLAEEHRQIAPADVEVLDLDRALGELAQMSSRQAQIVENLFFGDMTVGEVAETLGVSKLVVERDWRAAKRGWPRASGVPAVARR